MEPDAENDGEPKIMLTGALSAMLRLGLSQDFNAKSASDPGMFLSSVKVVAGARNHRELTLVALC